VNKFVVMANEHFEKGLIAFLNSYKTAKIKTPLVIIDTGLLYTYPFETIRIEPEKALVNTANVQKAVWMKDASPYLQLLLSDYIDADKIIYLEADMLILKNIDHLFSYIEEDNFIAVMDDAAYATTILDHAYIDSAGRYFKEGSLFREYYKYNKGYNGGLVGASKKAYTDLKKGYEWYINNEKEFRLLAQSLLNMYFVEEHISVHDLGLPYNFSGINEYYDKPYLYRTEPNEEGIGLQFMGVDISVVHFTGKNKPFFSEENNIGKFIWNAYYNKGVLL
jgi:lipopolysaccharide biosynthesis glycosyltransferase